MGKKSQNWVVCYWTRIAAKTCVCPTFSLSCLTCSIIRSALCQLLSSGKERLTVCFFLFVLYFKPVFTVHWFILAASIVLGVPTVKRESQSYLLPTLASLIESMNEEEKNDTLIIVFVAEVSGFLRGIFREKKLNFLGTAKRESYKRIIRNPLFPICDWTRRLDGFISRNSINNRPGLWGIVDHIVSIIIQFACCRRISSTWQWLQRR